MVVQGLTEALAAAVGIEHESIRDPSSGCNDSQIPAKANGCLDHNVMWWGYFCFELMTCHS